MKMIDFGGKMTFIVLSHKYSLAMLNEMDTKRIFNFFNFYKN